MSSEAMEVRDAAGSYVLKVEQEVPPGYKRTEVGVIPEDWECLPICEVAKLESGHTPSKREPSYWGGEISWVSLHDTKALDRGEIVSTEKTITEAGLANSSARLLPRGTVVFSRTATVGKTSVLGRVMATSQDFAAYICGPRLFNSFLVYLFRSMDCTWKSLMAGSIHNTIYMPVFRELKIPLPPIKEQRAIATALSDVDALITALDKLIAKKRAIKTAAMQQLLTGKTRLPGFSGEWDTKRLGDYVKFLRNGTNSRSELISEGKVKYLHYGDIHVNPNVYLDIGDTEMPCLPITKAKNLDRLRDGDLVFVDASEDQDGIGKSVEIVNVRDVEAVAGLHTIAARFDKSVLADGFKAFLQYIPEFRRHLQRLGAGTKVFATNRAHIASAEIRLPPVEEQIAIAQVLSDMDAEIAALEARRDKTRAIKQGMMQQLLTGRVRLVKPNSKEAA